MRFGLTCISIGSTWCWRSFSDEIDEVGPSCQWSVGHIGERPNDMLQYNSTSTVAESYFIVCSHLWAS